MFSTLSVYRISQKLMDGFAQNLVDTLGIWQGRTDSILVKIWLLEFLKWIFTFERLSQNDILHNISKSCGRIRMKLGGHVESVRRKNWFELGEDLCLNTGIFKWFFIIERSGQKQFNDISKSYEQIRTKLDGWVGLVTRTSRLDFGSGPCADQWGTKCKMFSLAEICALPSAGLVCFSYSIRFSQS